MFRFKSLIRFLALVSATAFIAAGCSMMPWGSKTVAFEAKLTSADEVPPNASPGTGHVDAWLNTKSMLLKWKATYSGTTGPVTAAHFHGPAAPGSNAPPVVTFRGGLTSPSEGEATITSAQADDLLAGKWYVNVHTAANPGGELRGQVMQSKK